MTQATERSAVEPSDAEKSKIWAHSGDSHAMESEDLWTSRLPKRLADRAPRTERGEKYEIVYVDGKQLSRQLNDFMDAMRPPGFKDLTIRLQDLDQEGVWAQLAFPSTGFWTVNIEDAELSRVCARAWNEWSNEEVTGVQDRIFTPAIVPLVEVADAVAELESAAGNRYQSIFLPCTMPRRRGVGPRRLGAAAGRPRRRTTWCSPTTSAPGARMSCTAALAARWSTTWRRRTRACGWSPTWWPAARWIAIPI